MKPRILIYGINYSPELTGVGKYTGEMGEWLSLNGYDVRVVTAKPYYPDWRVANGYNSWWYSSEEVNGVRVSRAPLWVPNRPTGGKRLLHLATFAFSSIPLLFVRILWKPHVVLVVVPTMFCAPAGWLMSRLAGSSAWLHIQDFEIEAAMGLGLLGGGEAFRRLFSRLEAWIFDRFDRVSSISDRMVERLINKGLSPKKVKLLKNWVSLEEVDNWADDAFKLRTELGLSKDVIVALYSGNMGNKQGLDILSDIATILEGEDRIVFVFCGNGSGRNDLELRCTNLRNVLFLDLQPLNRLGGLLYMADIHLLPQRADVADLVMPSKLVGMLASGRPTVASAEPETQVAITVAGNGLVVPPANPKKFSEAILKLAMNPSLRQKLGESARAYARSTLDVNLVLGNFETQLKELLPTHIAEIPKVTSKGSFNDK